MVSAGRDTCQNCGARVYGSQTFVDQRAAREHVYRTLFREEREMRFKRWVGIILIIIGIACLFIGFIFPNFLIGMVIIGTSLGLIIGGAITIYQNVKEFE